MATKQEGNATINISAPNFQRLTFNVKGTSPFLQCNFSQKAQGTMREKQAAGPQAKKSQAKVARNFDADYEGAKHISTEGWLGMPASAFRNACIDVCRMVGFKMTHAKMSVFVEADGHDVVNSTPLVRIYGEPERTEMLVRNHTGVADIRVRPLWRDWSVKLTIRFDADQFSSTDVANLLSRAGMQVGVGEGRPYSRESNGLGYGLFSIVEG